MEKDSQLENKLTTSELIDTGDFSGYRKPSLIDKVTASYHKCRSDKKKIDYNEKAIIQELTSAMSDSLANTCKQRYEMSLRGVSPGREELAEIFYKDFISRISPEGKLASSTQIAKEGADNFRYLTKRQLVKNVVPNLYGQISSVCNPYLLPLRYYEVKGLVISALVNYSDKIKKVKITDEPEMDYLGSFLSSGKELVVRPSTGLHFGYKRQEGSTVFTRRLRDMDKPKGLGRMLYDSFASEAKFYSKLVWSFGSALALAETYSALLVYNVIPPMSNSALQSIGLTQNEFYSGWFFLTQFGFPLVFTGAIGLGMGLGTLIGGTRNFLSAYKTQKVFFPKKMSEKA